MKIVSENCFNSRDKKDKNGIFDVVTLCSILIDKSSSKIFSNVLLAHLSQRLIGELIVYTHGPASVFVRPSSVVRRSQCSNIFSETTWPIKAKFYAEIPWVGGTIFSSRHVGHMTKMAATPKYGKNPSKISFSGTGGPISSKLGM